jgi:hypothetical protein
MRPVDRVGSGLTILLFGVTPWIWTLVIWLSEGPFRRSARRAEEALMIGTAVALVIGSIALVVAMVLGIFGVVAERRAARERAALASVEPSRSTHTGGLTLMARVASWVGIALVWGLFSAVLMSPVTVDKSIDLVGRATEQGLARSMIVVTLLSVVAGAARLRLSRRPRATPGR